MRPGVLLFGMMILIFSASFYYVQKPLATPANPDGWNDALEATLERWWPTIGMIIGGATVLAALLMPRARVNPMRSPMREYAKTSAGQEDSGYDFFH